jgi:hypothetical protein
MVDNRPDGDPNGVARSPGRDGHRLRSVPWENHRWRRVHRQLDGLVQPRVAGKLLVSVTARWSVGAGLVRGHAAATGLPVFLSGLLAMRRLVRRRRRRGRRTVSGLLRCPRRPEFSRDALQRRLRLVRQRLRGCCDRLLLGSELRANWRCGQRLLWSGRVPVLRGRCVLQRALQRLLLRALRGRWLRLSWLATYLWMRKQPPPRQSEVKP